MITDSSPSEPSGGKPISSLSPTPLGKTVTGAPVSTRAFARDDLLQRGDAHRPLDAGQPFLSPEIPLRAKGRYGNVQPRWQFHPTPMMYPATGGRTYCIVASSATGPSSRSFDARPRDVSAAAKTLPFAIATHFRRIPRFPPDGVEVAHNPRVTTARYPRVQDKSHPVAVPELKLTPLANHPPARSGRSPSNQPRIVNHDF